MKQNKSEGLLLLLGLFGVVVLFFFLGFFFFGGEGGGKWAKGGCRIHMSLFLTVFVSPS